MNAGNEFVEPWASVGRYAQNLEDELKREVTDSHVLWGCKAKAIAQRIDTDDVLFEVDCGEGSYAVVYLTWKGRPEMGHRWPVVRLFKSFEAWVEECMLKDHAEYMRE
ncbi:MAG: hypothetical protein PVH19_08095 [Planctomycetia bacterium]|jgi:hypothetical protein